MYVTEYVKLTSLLKRISAFSCFPLGPMISTSTLPLPAENVSTVKFAGASTTGPVGSIPGP